MDVGALTMDPPRLIISTSSADTFGNKTISEMSPPIESIELTKMGDASDGPHRHTVEISVGRKKHYMAKILFSVCLVALIAGSVLITSVRDWNYIGLGGGSMINKNWGASVSVEPWDIDDNDSDLITAQVGRVWRIPYRTPTLFVQRETVYDKIFPYFSFQREVFGVALMPPESIAVKKRKLIIPNSTGVVREKRFISAAVFLVILWSTISAAAAASVAGGIAYSLTKEHYESVVDEYESKIALLQTTTPEPV